MQLGVDGVFVGSGIFKSQNPAKTAKAIIDSVAHFNDAKKTALYFEQMVKQKPYVIYNNAELALSILIAFKEHMPK
jgi:pyridoxal biosynthesis lyase PdxS